jgi:hypothetical protein
MTWAEHVARIGEKINTYRVKVVNLKEGEYFEKLGVEGR